MKKNNLTPLFLHLHNIFLIPGQFVIVLHRALEPEHPSPVVCDNEHTILFFHPGCPGVVFPKNKKVSVSI